MRAIAILVLLLACLSANAQRRALLESKIQAAAAGGSSYDPSTDANAVRWMRVEGTTGTNASNGAITNLLERKGGIPYTNRTALANGPIITNAYVNGKAAAGFYGTNWLQAAFGNLTGYTSAHMFAVVNTALDNGTTLAGWWRFTGGDGQSQYWPFGTDIYSSFGSSTRHNFNPSASLTAWRLIEIVSVSGRWEFRIDGATELNDGSNTVAWDTFSDPEVIGANDLGGSGAWQGWIAEIIVRDSEATGSTLTDIRSYFDTQYNLAY